MPTALADVRTTHEALVAAYQATARRSDELVGLDRAYVRHVLAISSAAAARRLRTRGGAADLVAATEKLAADYGSEDVLGGVSGVAKAQARKQLLKALVNPIAAVTGIGVLLVSGAALIDSLGDLGQQGGAAVATFILSGGVTGAMLYFLVRAGVAIAQAVQNVNLSGPPVSASVSTSTARHELARTLDDAERRFFAATGGTPPSRWVLHAVPIVFWMVVGLYLIFVAVIVIGFISGFSETVTGPQNPLVPEKTIDLDGDGIPDV